MVQKEKLKNFKWIDVLRGRVLLWSLFMLLIQVFSLVHLK